ncbi:PH domain-containing protein [Chloroflexota bacterium]
MTFQPYPTRSGFVLLGVAIIFGATAAFLLSLLLQPNDLSISFRLFAGLLLTLAITMIALYWTTIAARLRYHLNRNGLAIQWGLTQHRIPFENIQTVIPGKDLSTLAQFWGLNLIGLRLGWGRLAEYGLAKFHTTTSVANSLLVVTPNRTYVISPRHPDRFLQAWQDRQSLGPTQEWSTRVQRSWPLNTPFLADPLAWSLLGLAGLFWLALAGYLAAVYAELPAALPVHFNALGHADRIADKSTLLILPAVGVVVLIINALLGELIYRREKVAAYLLWGSTIVMQVCLWIAVLTIIG